MQPLNLLTKSITLCTIAIAGLVACTLPTQAQANATSSSTYIAQANNVLIAQRTSANNAAKRVENALDSNSTLRRFNLDADNEGNAIVLRGTVRNVSQRALAEDVAKRTAPGFRIINRIRVQ